MLRNHIYFIALTALLALSSSCSNHTDSDKGKVESYSTDGCKSGTVNEAFSDVELTELKYDGNYYPKAIGRMSIDSEMLFISDAQDNVYIYSLDGEPIACSLSARGEGPGEHNIVMGSSWNPYSRLIEIVTPKELMFYDLNFKFVKSCDLKTQFKKHEEKARMYSNIYDLSPDIHLLEPSASSERPFRYVVYNSKEQEEVGEISYEEDVWSFINMQGNCFFKMPDGQILCHPHGLLPYSYALDSEALTITKVIELKASGDEITRNDIKNLSGDEAQKAAYFLKCDKSIPVNTILTPSKMLVTFKTGNSIRGFSTVVFSRGTDEATRFNLYEGEKRAFPLITYATDEYAYSIVEKAVIEENPSLLLGSEERFKELGTFDDESWVVMKYRFKD